MNKRHSRYSPNRVGIAVNLRVMPARCRRGCALDRKICNRWGITMNVAGRAHTKAAFYFCLALGLFLGQAVSAQPRGAAPESTAPRGGFDRAPDPRVEQRTYRFTETDEDLAYALFVSSKVSKNGRAHV